MSTQRLITEFDRLAEAPGAIPELREFIRALAVRGRLSEHDVTDTSARELRANILAERARLTEEAELRKRDALPEPTVEEIPFDVPPNWAVVRLGEAVELVNGRAFKPSEWSKTGTPIVRIQNLNDERAPFNYCNFEVPEKVRIRNGDFLISWSGTPGTSFGAHIWRRGDGVLNQHIFKARLLGGAFEPAFLRLAINSRLLELILQAQGGVGLQHITKPKLEALVLTLPPFAEQRRIVAKVDELMALCDRLEAAQAERERRRDRLAAVALGRLGQLGEDDSKVTGAQFVLSNFPQLIQKPETAPDLRRSILRLAVRGDLVPQSGADESALETLARTPRPKRPARFDNKSPLRIDGDCGLAVGKPEIPLPSGWAWVPLVDIARLESGHTPSRNKPEWWGGDVQWITLVDARKHNDGTIRETEQTTNEAGIANSSARVLPAGTVCVSRTASVGYVVIMGRDMATSQDFVNWVPTPAISPEWLQLVIMAERGAFRRFSKGAIHQTIYFPEWMAMHIALPPVAEQKRIVARARELLALCDDLQTKFLTERARAKKLLNAVIHEAVR